MSTYKDQQMPVARVYSDALLQLARNKGMEEELMEELDELTAMLGDRSDLRTLFESPVVDVGKREQSLETMFRGRASDLLVDALQVLNRKRRLGLVPTIAEAYRRSYNELHRRIDVSVTTAVPLSDAQRDRLRGKIREQTDREPTLRESVDPDLLGGMVVRIGDRKLDSSLTTRLEALSGALLARGSREVGGGAHVED